MPITVGDNTGVPSADALAIVAAYNEADRIADTLAGLRSAFPDATIWVADDGSRDRTAAIARQAGAEVVSSAHRVGKGRAMTATVATALEGAGSDSIVLLCDGDLGACASELAPLVEAIRRKEADLAIAAFSTRATGGFGVALAFARWVVRRRCVGLRLRAPLSGQRALHAGTLLRDLLPFAPGYGMELGMTIDAARAGHRVTEIDLPLTHRPTGRTPRGFVHRGRQLVDFVRVYSSRRYRGNR
jgi:glycosyltransferase involved in cell wall biosynthesis